MKTKFYYLLLCFYLLLSSGSSDASHVNGFYISYQHISGNTYLFKLRLFRDCTGIPAPNSLIVCFRTASGSVAPFTAQLTVDSATSGFMAPFNTCNGVGPTYCNGGNIFSFQVYNYLGAITVPPASDWIVSYDVCCRSSANTNIINGPQSTVYTETRFDNLNYPGNSSPDFNTIPPNYYCLGIPAVRDYSAFDPDGDSLSYEFTDVFSGTGCNGNPFSLTFVPPYTYDQPLASFIPTTLDPLSGMFQFIPSALQISSVGFKVNEYRNGVLIGSVGRDDAITTVGVLSNPDTISGRVYVDLNTNGVFDATDIPMGGEVVQLGPGANYSIAAGNGKYELIAIAGSYNIFLPNPPPYTVITPMSYNITTAGGSSYMNNDFVLEPVPNMNDLVVNINNTVNPAPGFTMPLVVNYSNVGSTDQYNVQLTVTLDTLASFTSAAPAPTMINGNTLTWDIPFMGMFSSGLIYIYTGISQQAQLGTPVSIVCTISSSVTDLTPNNNIDNIDTYISAPADPNFKENTPSGDISPAFVASQDWIYYKIHFQNLGTAPAQIVRIRDLIDNDLDLSSIEITGYSFPCSMSLINGHEVEFNFFGINLPPDSLDEPGSHGFVEYRVKPVSTLSVGSLITNNASIYFDFNAPIHTNLVSNMVVVPTSVNEVLFQTIPLKLFPSPVTDELNIEFNIEGNQSQLRFEVYDLPGTTVLKNDVRIQKGKNNLKLDVSKLSSGVYFLKLGGNSSIQVQKFVVIRD